MAKYSFFPRKLAKLVAQSGRDEEPAVSTQCEGLKKHAETELVPLNK